jgi:hypothetical protein
MFQTSTDTGPLSNVQVLNNCVGYIAAGDNVNADEHAGMNFTYGAPVTNLTVTGNTVQDAPSVGILVKAPVNGGTFDHNTIENSATKGAALGPSRRAGFYFGGTLQNVTCSGNQITDTRNPALIENGIWSEANCTGSCAATGNTLSAVSTLPLLYTAPGSSAWTTN